MSGTLTVNGIHAVSIRKVTPMIGAWFLEADLDLSTGGSVPSGAVSVVIGTNTLSGTVDPRGTGKLGEKATVRVIGGGAGWDKPVRAQHYHNDAGVTLSAVIAATAAEIGEVSQTLTDSALGVDYVRTSGPASRVLSGVQWYVNNLGITVIGARTPVVADKDASILTWKPEAHQVEVAFDGLVEPGWSITDDRFGTVKVCDVEQTWNENGSRATAWTSTGTSSRLWGPMAAAVREFSGVANLKVYPYRVFSMQGENVKLQATTKSHPDLLPSPIWYGLPGVTGMLSPATNVLTHLVEGDPSKPAVTSFDDTPPIEMTLEAITKYAIKALTVELGEAAPTGVSTMATLTPLLTLLIAQNAALILWLNDPSLVGTFAPSAATLTPLLAALAATSVGAALPTNFSLTVKAAA